ncbi:MAG: isoamylase early set domain-containing protein [Limisphaerales bacterium]
MNSQIYEPNPNVIASPNSAKRTRHHMDFFCDAPQAQSVRLVGDFNGWDLAATPMQRMPDGRWMAGLELYHGHHQYLFVVDGHPVLDPKANGIARNDHNERVSLVAIS